MAVYVTILIDHDCIIIHCTVIIIVFVLVQLSIYDSVKFVHQPGLQSNSITSCSTMHLHHCSDGLVNAHAHKYTQSIYITRYTPYW